MPPKRIARLRIAICCVQLICLAGCQPKPPPKIDYAQPLPPGELALRKLSPGEYPDFSAMDTNLADLRRAIENSLRYLQAPSSRQFYPYLDITYERAVATLRALREAVDARSIPGGGEAALRSMRSGKSWNDLIRQSFEVYQSVGAPDASGGYSGKVLFTGYFTPVYDASLTREGEYAWPLYKRPTDLVVDPAHPWMVRRRSGDAEVVPYYSRQEIESGKLAGQELVWLRSRWEAYVITVQGSARLRLRDRRIYEIGYDGNNGYAYTSPGERMVADGRIRKEDLSLKSMASYFRAHPEEMDKYLWLNARTVFFTERPGGPFGSLNVPVTPMASIATDKSVYPRAMPAFLMVRVPVRGGGTRNFSGMMLDQDTGGAIRAAGRCDIYMGVGAGAEELAGHQLYAGKLYYLAIRPELLASHNKDPFARNTGW